MGVGVSKKIRGGTRQWICPQGYLVADSSGRPGPSASHPDKIGEVALIVRSREALDVRFYNCERLLWSCLDVAEGSEAVINDDHLHRVAPSVVENLSADVRTHAATPNGKRSESASVYRYADR